MTAPRTLPALRAAVDIDDNARLAAEIAAMCDVAHDALALIRGPLADAIDAAGSRTMADEMRALTAAGDYHHALMAMHRARHVADRISGPLGARIECLAWAARGMLLRRSTPIEARAFAASWLAEAERWLTSPRCHAQGWSYDRAAPPVDESGTCATGAGRCSARPRAQQLTLAGVA